jgi:transcription-repair coupling factor (superfamily II helicase)
VLSETELFGFTRRTARKRHSDKPRLLFSELKPGDLVVHETHGIGRFVAWRRTRYRTTPAIIF